MSSFSTGALAGEFASLIGFAVGTGVGPILRPPVQDLINEAWSLHPVRPIDALYLAHGVAQGQVARAYAETHAGQTGYSTDTFGHMVDIANVGPGMAQAFNLWRRGQLKEAGFKRALQRLGLEQEWIDDLWNVREDILDPAQLAVMVQRGIVPNDGLLPVGPPTATGKVPPMPVVPIDTLTEAAGSGINFDRLAAMARIVGLPASPDLAARMVFRGIIDRIDFDRAISEGNTRNEWAPFLFEGFRQIPTALEFIEGRLRGWLDDTGMYDGTHRHGMSRADTDFLRKVVGRPIAFRQVFIGERRGGRYDGPTDAINPAILKSLQESNIRPEWYNLADAQKESYPSAFVIRSLLQGGALTEAQGEELFLHVGWPAWLAKLVAQHYATATGAVADPHVSKAQVQLWTTIHSSYLSGKADQTAVESNLPAAGVAPAAVSQVVDVWNVERTFVRKLLTPKQVKDAYRGMVINEDTGAAWTHDDARAALVGRGFSLSDADTFLAE